MNPSSEPVKAETEQQDLQELQELRKREGLPFAVRQHPAQKERVKW
jgi:hypothetical protein